MSTVVEELRFLLEEGLRVGLYSGASAAISTPAGRVSAWVGTLAADDPTPVTADSLFDLASVTKTFTAATIVRLAERGVLDLDAPVNAVGNGMPGITLRRLLLHTSGLPAESFLWRDAAVPPAERLDRVLATTLESAPDEVYRYSCLGYIAAGTVAERATGIPLPELLGQLVLQPLGLSSVGYGPVESSRAVATEDEPWVGRGMVRGEVHDELSWYLGGRVGNAGLFGTAADVLTFAESFLDDRLFGAEARAALTQDGLEPRHSAAYGQALGPRIGDREVVGEVPALGHPGFTGTMWMAVPDRGVAAALLTNRVHPVRDRVDLTEFRKRFSTWAGTAA